MPIATTAYAIACVFGAAIVRGYAGFGFSLLAVTAIALALPPATVAPSIFLTEIAASLHLLPSVWREVHWRAIGLLLLGCLAATPWGVWLLATVPAAPMQVALGAVVLAAAVLLRRGHALRAMPGRAATVATGAASGLLNGAFGIGGPPVVLFFFASPAGAAAGRASVIAYFLGTDTIGLAFMLQQGLIGREQLALALVFLPALAAGVWIGARGFRHADPDAFRRWTLSLLMLLAALTAGQGLLTTAR
ncbi:MAG TPA: sulfite exporter TauE/SafE family protein [Geminicoccaceae bacterium]|nr:sulfite exporter TauE/SafE family protein [Geminicoccaceae bacterium]